MASILTGREKKIWLKSESETFIFAVKRDPYEKGYPILLRLVGKFIFDSFQCVFNPIYVCPKLFVVFSVLA